MKAVSHILSPYVNVLTSFQCVCALQRRVHISQSTMECLRGEFELEPGNGGERCEYLLEKGIDTYLVRVPKQKSQGNGLNGNVSGMELCLTRSLLAAFKLHIFLAPIRLLSRMFSHLNFLITEKKLQLC